MKLVWVQCDEFTGWATRIFKNQKAALFAVENFVRQMDRALAISQIRRQILERQEKVCINCPEMLTLSSMHLHEKLHRGQFDSDGRSGEISLENSEGLCANCHILGPRSAHGKERSPQFTNPVRNADNWEPITR